jgi:thioredoxin-dependent peroxiredoxin
MNVISLKAIFVVLISCCAVCLLTAGEAPKKPHLIIIHIKVGDKAPLVTGKNQSGKTWKLADSIGKKIVLLYFYPKDGTPGCTKEACSFRDHMAEFKKDNVEVVGVSFDSAESHQQFIEENKLNFPLIADPDGKISDMYQVRSGEKDIDRRVSYLIGLDGKIAHITDAPQPEFHLTQMKAAIEELKKK